MTIRAILIACTIFFLGACSSPKEVEQPNIIFILADDLGFTDLGCAGSDLYQTPNIDGLASDGIYFKEAYSSHPTCQPSRMSLLTGKYPARLGAVSHGELGGVKSGDNNMPLSEVTYAQALKNAGYTTGHIGKWHVSRGENNPSTRGFDEDIASNDFCCPASFFYPFTDPKQTEARNKIAGVPDLEHRAPGDFLTDCLADEAVQFINTHKEGPFFLNLWFYAVHTPIQAKQEKIEKYEGLITAETHHNNPEYAGLVEHLDDGVGKVLDALEENGISDNTIVIFMSDNGGEIWYNITKNDPLREGKGFSYEGGVRVPMIVKWPGKTIAGSTTSQKVIGFDIYPTLLSMANAEGDAKHNENLDGYDLTPLLKDPSYQLPGREIHFLRYLSMVHFKMPIPLRNRCVETVIKGDWKLMEFFEMPGGLEHYYELFNLKEDPSESTNLADKYPDKVTELKESMSSWREEVNAPAYDMEDFYGHVKL